jgi:hypothetical protein
MISTVTELSAVEVIKYDLVNVVMGHHAQFLELKKHPTGIQGVSELKSIQSGSWPSIGVKAQESGKQSRKQLLKLKSILLGSEIKTRRATKVSAKLTN